MSEHYWTSGLTQEGAEACTFYSFQFLPLLGYSTCWKARKSVFTKIRLRDPQIHQVNGGNQFLTSEGEVEDLHPLSKRS